MPGGPAGILTELRSGHGGKHQEDRENYEVNRALQNGCASGGKRHRAREQRKEKENHLLGLQARA